MLVVLRSRDTRALAERRQIGASISQQRDRQSLSFFGIQEYYMGTIYMCNKIPEK